ncbi:MAG: ATP-binding protein [Anaerolineales bacterium]
MVAATDAKIERLTREMHALTEIAKTLTSTIDLRELLFAIMEKIVGVLEPAEIGAIMLWDQAAGLFRPWAAFGYEFEIFKKIGLSRGECITGKVYDAGKACLLVGREQVAGAMQNLHPDNRAILNQALGSDQIPVCTLAAPISIRDDKLGVLILEILHGSKKFSEEDLPFIQTIADLVALAIERARLGAKAEAKRDERQAERLNSELMATLSHELRLPLTAIKGYATALMLDEVDWSGAKRGEFLSMIEEECDTMEAMLTDILDSALIEIERLSIELQPLRTPQVALDVANEMNRRTDRHRILVDFPPDFPVVEGDHLWIKQVFRNILDNAIKYSPEGGLIVIRGEKRATNVAVHISDQGIGISPEELITIFEKYSRAKLPEGMQIPGTGLGLPVARSIVEAHGGRIWAESKLGEGTTLSFSLPIRHPPGREERGEKP